MNKKKTLILVLILILLTVFFINRRYIFNVDNILKDISFLPYSIFTNDKKLDKSDDFLQAELINKNKEIEELKNLLSLTEINSNYKIINASIIGRNMQYFYDEVIINKGTKDGISKDMAVVNKDGLIGKIVSVNKNNSVVKLITSAGIYNMLSVQIMVDNGFIYGILNDYDKETNSFIIEGIDQNVTIKENSLVETTGLGNIYPSGIVIGKVVRIQKDNFDLAYILKVKPIINFDNFHYVAVLDRGNND